MYNHNLKKFWPMFVAHGSRNIKSLLPSVAGALRRRSCAPLFRSYSQLAYSPEMVFADRISTMPDVYRVPESTPLPFSNEDSLRIFELMLKVNVIDSILNDVQRQGRISFYMTNFGEEATQLGTITALRFEDVLWPQYRELGCFLYRGFTIQNITDQCMSTKYETGKGRQMPVHYCFPEGNIHAVTSPLGTKIPQASGAGYGMRVDGRDECAVVYFGDGAASEGDFAVGLNFAATLKSQTMFICRNNGYAISTPVSEQYAGDGGIVARGIAYGIPSIRVDGNCVLSVHLATKRAREICIKEKRPVLLELMTFRRGHHSTSDDSSRYRDNSGDDWQYWTRPDIEPISRYKELLKKHGVCAPTHGDLDTYEKEYRQSIRNEVLQSLKLSESKKRAPIMEMFKDVYHDIPPHLKEQQELLQKHLQDNKERYGNETMNIYEEGEEH